VNTGKDEIMRIWIPVSTNPSEIIYRRDLVVGTFRQSYNGTWYQAISSLYIAGTEDKAHIGVGTGFSNGTIQLLSTQIRYYHNSIWSTWETIPFTVTIPSTSNTFLSYSYDYLLPTTTGYEAYDIKLLVSVPSANGNQALTTVVDYSDIPSETFDPLNPNPPAAIPKPSSIFLLLSGLISIIFKKFKQ